MAYKRPFPRVEPPSVEDEPEIGTMPISDWEQVIRGLPLDVLYEEEDDTLWDLPYAQDDEVRVVRFPPDDWEPGALSNF
jgi:hypothetical protein